MTLAWGVVGLLLIRTASPAWEPLQTRAPPTLPPIIHPWHKIYPIPAASPVAPPVEPPQQSIFLAKVGSRSRHKRISHRRSRRETDPVVGKALQNFYESHGRNAYKVDLEGYRDGLRRQRLHTCMSKFDPEESLAKLEGAIRRSAGKGSEECAAKHWEQVPEGLQREFTSRGPLDTPNFTLPLHPALLDLTVEPKCTTPRMVLDLRPNELRMVEEQISLGGADGHPRHAALHSAMQRVEAMHQISGNTSSVAALFLSSQRDILWQVAACLAVFTRRMKSKTFNAVATSTCHVVTVGKRVRSASTRLSFSHTAYGLLVNPPKQPYSTVVAPWSLDVLGLGRLGDPLDPQGDTLMLTALRCNLRAGGAMVIGVRIGEERIEWNAGRVYGMRGLVAVLGLGGSDGPGVDSVFVAETSGVPTEHSAAGQPLGSFLANILADCVKRKGNFCDAVFVLVK